jgi:hypothetical protein
MPELLKYLEHAIFQFCKLQPIAFQPADEKSNVNIVDVK